jgi:enoyl-CoA hydratase/carnithine racemase
LTEAEALARETEAATRLARTADAVEGPRSFIEKRSPKFIGA